MVPCPEQISGYKEGLDAAHELRQSALASSTITRQNKVTAELWSWLNRYRPGVTPATCTVEDLVYLVPVYLVPDLWEPRLSVPSVMALYLALCADPNAPPGSCVQDLLFRPLTPDHRGFKDAPLSSSSMGARLRLHLHAAGLYGGETVHSFRRGALQHAQATGRSESSLLEMGQLRTTAVLERYLDRNRHLEQRDRVA